VKASGSLSGEGRGRTLQSRVWFRASVCVFTVAASFVLSRTGCVMSRAQAREPLHLLASHDRGKNLVVNAIARVATSSDIVLGRVSEVRSFAAGATGARGIHTRVTLEVHLALRGASAGHVEFWLPGGVLGDRARVVSGQPSFVVGESALVFLTRRAASFVLTAADASKWSVADDLSSNSVLLPRIDEFVDASRGERVPLSSVRSLLGDEAPRGSTP
jgi:hypothetical protein